MPTLTTLITTATITIITITFAIAVDITITIMIAIILLLLIFICYFVIIVNICHYLDTIIIFYYNYYFSRCMFTLIVNLRELFTFKIGKIKKISIFFYICIFLHLGINFSL